MNGSVHKWQVAIVTGASGGIGWGITQAPVGRGYGFVANSCNGENIRIDGGGHAGARW